jgi:hypothetical protein
MGSVRIESIQVNERRRAVFEIRRKRFPAEGYAYGQAGRETGEPLQREVEADTQ